ncbi:MAG: DUF1640 domain-containing protein [Alphaproteobacteria bacterium]|nr:DUF1640 domain-containing protein [Alphaproteobacteria bacterium]
MKNIALKHGDIMFIDTYKTIQQLVDADFSEKQAAAITGKLVEVNELNLSNLAAKGDVQHVNNKLSLIENDIQSVKIDIRVTEAFIRKDIEALDLRLNSMDNNFTTIDERFAKIDERFTKIDERFTKIDERFDNMDKKLIEHDNQFRKIDNRFDKVELLIDVKIDRAINKLIFWLVPLLIAQSMSIIAMMHYFNNL